jgi:hypothetical protein
MDHPRSKDADGLAGNDPKPYLVFAYLESFASWSDPNGPGGFVWVRSILRTPTNTAPEARYWPKSVRVRPRPSRRSALRRGTPPTWRYARDRLTYESSRRCRYSCGKFARTHTNREMGERAEVTVDSATLTRQCVIGQKHNNEVRKSKDLPKYSFLTFRPMSPLRAHRLCSWLCAVQPGTE